MKTVRCKACKELVEVTPGLPEIEDHYELYHADQLEEIRKALGHDEEAEGFEES